MEDVQARLCKYNMAPKTISNECNKKKKKKSAVFDMKWIDTIFNEQHGGMSDELGLCESGEYESRVLTKANVNVFFLSLLNTRKY